MRKQIISIILIIVIVFNFCIPNTPVYATGLFEDMQYTESSYKALEDGEANVNNKPVKVKTSPNTPGTVVTALVGVISIIPSMIITLMSIVVSATEVKEFKWVSVKAICFGEISMFDINFFDVTSSTGTMRTIKENVAAWYYALRNLSIIMFLCILIYIGIRMALSTVSSDKAEYKKWFVTWVKSFVLLFVMHIMLIFAILLADNLINLIRPIMSESSMEMDFGTAYIKQIQILAGWGVVESIIMLIFLTFTTLRFFWLYSKRMLVIAFLIIIAPIITVMYSLNQTEAYKTWFKEIMINIFIQPIHAILYIVFFLSAGEIAKKSPLIAIVFLMALSRGEKIVKDLFNLRGQKTINSMSEYMKLKGG